MDYSTTLPPRIPLRAFRKCLFRRKSSYQSPSHISLFPAFHYILSDLIDASYIIWNASWPQLTLLLLWVLICCYFNAKPSLSFPYKEFRPNTYNRAGVSGLGAIMAAVAKRGNGPLGCLLLSIVIAVLSGHAPRLETVKGWHLAWLWYLFPGVSCPKKKKSNPLLFDVTY